MQYGVLEQMLINSIKEVSVKLGYEKEPIHFYYPLRALANILRTPEDSEGEMRAAVEDFKEEVKERLGDVRVTRSGQRFCFEIPSKGVEYVHDHAEDNGFLKEFIAAIESPGVTLDEILEVFQKFTKGKVICVKSQEEEYDYIVFFEDSSVDNYRYYIKFHENHAIYHRFLCEDAADMGI